MSRFEVDGTHLLDVATTLGDLSNTLNGIVGTVPDYAQYLGGRALEQEITAFTDKWQYGVVEVSGEVVDMMGRLRQAAAAYARIDKAVYDGTHDHMHGPPPPINGSGPGGHGHPGRGHGPGPRPPVPRGPGAGRGTTVVGGGPTRTRGTRVDPKLSHITIQSDLLTRDQETFVGKLAALTGLSPRVLAAWSLSEESSTAAQARQGAGNNDWLNIGYFDSGRGGISYGQAWGDPTTAAEQTAKFLQGTWGGASPSIRDILNSAGKSPADQIQAISSSDWASSHYDGSPGNPPGTLLHETYAELSGMTVHEG